MVLPRNSYFSLPLWGKSFGPNRKLVVMDLSDLITAAGKETGFEINFEQQMWGGRGPGIGS